MPAHDLNALREVYRAADDALAGWSCDGSADCCRFDETGREPYLWPNEWALVSAAIARRGRPARSLPILGPCPLLDRVGRCTIYESRPFGCRTFLCDRAEGPTRRPPRAALVELSRKIASLSERAEPGAGPRTLTRWLSDSRCQPARLT